MHENHQENTRIAFEKIEKRLCTGRLSDLQERTHTYIIKKQGITCKAPQAFHLWPADHEWKYLAYAYAWNMMTACMVKRPCPAFSAILWYREQGTHVFWAHVSLHMHACHGHVHALVAQLHAHEDFNLHANITSAGGALHGLAHPSQDHHFEPGTYCKNICMCENFMFFMRACMHEWKQCKATYMQWVHSTTTGMHACVQHMICCNHVPCICQSLQVTACGLHTFL